MAPREGSARWHVVFALATLLVFAWSGWMPRDRPTWILEVAPVPIAAALIAIAYPRWRFTPLVLLLIALHAAVLRPTPSSARRATFGTRSGTCSSPSAGRSSRS